MKQKGRRNSVRNTSRSRKTKKQSGPTPERLMQMAWGYTAPLIIEAALKAGVFDILDKGPRTLEELVARTGASARGLRGILDALVGLEFARKKGNRYALTPESSAFLVSAKPGYHGGFFKHMSSQLIPNWLRLNDAVQTGKPAVKVNDSGHGEEFFAELVTALFPMGYKASQVLGENLGVPKARSPVSVLDLG